jgi:hypothetical protein
MMFKPGDEVICINAEPQNNRFFQPSDFSEWPVEGRKYTIRAYRYFELAISEENAHGVLLQEIRGPRNEFYDDEQYLKACRFRKIQKTDIGVFEQFKNPKVRELEPSA